jgi:hypothetical protein
MQQWRFFRWELKRFLAVDSLNQEQRPVPKNWPLHHRKTAAGRKMQSQGGAAGVAQSPATLTPWLYLVSYQTVGKMQDQKIRIH